MDEEDSGLVAIMEHLLLEQNLDQILEETYHLQVSQPSYRQMMGVLQIIGEQGCSASALSKSRLADVFEMGTLPQKCDGLLKVGSVEVGNFEYNRVGASSQEVACQLRENIKINKSMSAIIFRVRKWRDIWVAGKASIGIVLPSTYSEFRLFLRHSIYRLDNLLNHYHEYGAHVDQVLQEYQYREMSEDEEEAVFSSPYGVQGATEC
ncbi:hypothetical protein BGZ58_005056 [Dissophora ornata]|nr:hypothetical protein BGZ58_005056 [Dissophora ornata]